MPKPLIQLLLALLLVGSVHAQETVTDSILLNKDSIEKELDDFLRLFDSIQQPKSYFLIGVGIGNTQFSVKNISLNSQQQTNNLSIIPTLGYYHKSGISLTYNNYLLKEKTSTQLLQHSLTFAYDNAGSKAVDYGISFTRFMGKKEFVNTSSPYDNDLLAYINKKEGFFQPGIMVGFSAGKYRETSRYLDSQYVIYPGPGYRYFYVNDTSTIKVRDLTIIPYLQTEFEWNGIGKKDLIVFKPSLMLISGINKFTIDSKGRRSVLQYPRVGRNYSESASQSSGFNLQSLGLSLDATWYIGKFYINPQVYFDYYLLSSENKFNTLYTIQAGIMF